MPNSYTQLYIQLVFAVKNRKSLITSDIRVSIEKYMTGIIQNNGHKLLAIYCMPDHCHILIGLNPKQSISELVRLVKTNCSKFINENKLSAYHFNWQKGYGAFSYSKNRLSNVIKYIINQPIHHKQYQFKEEYLVFLNEFDIDYDEKYLFDWIMEP